MGAIARQAGWLGLVLLVACCSEPSRDPGQRPRPRPDQPVPADRRGEAVALEHVEQMREQTFRAAALGPGMVVADVGCGGGWFTMRAARTVGTSGVVYATDIDPEAVSTMRRRIPHMDPGLARIDVRLCRGQRDTALDDLPDDSIDVIFMVDSLCFDRSVSHEDNVAYLRRFLRKLRPGGRLVHHMDCTCDVASAALGALFEEAGFSPHVEQVDFPSPRPAAPAARCRTDAERERHWFTPIFRKLGG